MRVLLGDQTGQVRAELDEGSIGNIAWRLNTAGTATVWVKRGSTAFRRELLEPGARIYVSFENGLPAWGGLLDLPRDWSPNLVEIRAYTIERLLKFRMTPKTRAFYDEPVGSIFVKILLEAEQREPSGLTIGQVWYGGAAHWPRYHFRDAMWVTNNSIRKMENCDYRFLPYLDDGKIRFRAELHQLLGDDKREKVLLCEGANIASGTLSEQGEIVNRVAVVGTGSTWGEREVVYGVEETSRRTYGLRERMIAPSDVSLPTTLYRYADNAIRDDAYPHRLATLVVANVPPSRYADYDVGDIVRVNMPSYGFDGYDAPMRVIARGYDPASGECEVVCDERFEYLPVLKDESREEGEET